jgi:hypothetical protein
MTIMIHVAGAQPEDIVRGLFAAQAVFDRAGVTPDQGRRRALSGYAA